MAKRIKSKEMGPGKIFLGVSLLWLTVFLIGFAFFYADKCNLTIKDPAFVQNRKDKEKQEQRAKQEEVLREREEKREQLAELFPAELQEELKANNIATIQAPLSCYPPKVPKGLEPEPFEFTVSGDPKYGTIVFLFNGRDMVRQFYLKAGESYQVKATFGGYMFSAMAIFGKNYRKDAIDPCNGTGYFTDDIAYAGINSYAARPFPFEADKETELKIRRTYIRRKYSEKSFFDQLDKFY